MNCFLAKESEVLFSHPDIPLATHLKTVATLISEISKELPVNESLKKLAYIAGLTHDLGKATFFFQNRLRGRPSPSHLSTHSLLSAVLATFCFYKHLSPLSRIYLFTALKHHHSTLSNLINSLCINENDLEILKIQLQKIPLKPFRNLLVSLGLDYQNFEKFRVFKKDTEFFDQNLCWLAEDLLPVDYKNPSDLRHYFFINFLLGLLVDADIKSVVEVDSREIQREELPENLVDNYLLTLKTSSPLANLRKEFYQLVINNILKFGEQGRIFSITAPTGIGKTLAGFSAALKLRNLVFKKENRLPRIIYVLPFTTIIEQVWELIKDLLIKFNIKEEILIKHHYRTSPLASKKLPSFEIKDLLEENYINSFLEEGKEQFFKLFEKVYTQIESWDGEIIITTFVRLYETLFTNHRKEMVRLPKLAGSIIILDEIQNIPAKYWELTERAFEFLAQNWNTSFILMTATKPALFPNTIELTQPKKEYFFNFEPITKISNFYSSRTELKINLSPVSYMDVGKWLIPLIKNTKSFLVILNTIHSAQQVYKQLKEKISSDFKLFFLSASLIPLDREKRIEEIKMILKRGEKIGLISTQVVEAGIDFDFEKVIRDFAPLDSLIQSAGRCNRNFNYPKGEVYIVNLIDPENQNKKICTYVYDPILIRATFELISEYKSLSESEYLNLVETYFKNLRKELKTQDKSLLHALVTTDYDKVSRFKFIEKEIPDIPFFIETDEGASLVIKKLETLKKLPSSKFRDKMKRKLLFKAIKKDMWNYIITLPLYIASKTGLPTLPYAESVIWLPKTHPYFDKYYDRELGFFRKLDHFTFIV